MALQSAIVELFVLLGVFKRAIVFSVPNEAKRSPVMASRLKKSGMLPGVTDLVIVKEGRAHFLEVKTEKGKLSGAQLEFRELCKARGAPWAVVRSPEEARRQLEEWSV